MKLKDLLEIFRFNRFILYAYIGEKIPLVEIQTLPVYDLVIYEKHYEYLDYLVRYAVAIDCYSGVSIKVILDCAFLEIKGVDEQ